MFVPQVVTDPVVQGSAGLTLLAAVSIANGERHEGWQVVGTELQAPEAGEQLVPTLISY